MNERMRECDKTFLVLNFCLTFRHFFGDTLYIFTWLKLTDTTADSDDCVGVVVENIEKNNERLEHVEEHRADGETLQRFPETRTFILFKSRSTQTVAAVSNLLFQN